MSEAPNAAMVLAAGLGRRMRPLTEDTAKALLPLGGRPLIDHALDRLAEAGVSRVVVNAHWQAARLAAHLQARADAGRPPRTILQREPELLDTGGAVAAALARGDLGPEPFYVVNGDAFWVDGPRRTLRRLVEAFRTEALDGVLLVHRGFQVHADVGFGDFALDKWGAPRRRGEREIVPYVYAGVQLAAPTLFAGFGGRFSMNLAWDRAMETGRLRAVVHDGLWFHLSTPADLADAESRLHARATGDAR
jgi:MurNAc alpha-1-phosphate uridylyltransferase